MVEDLSTKGLLFLVGCVILACFVYAVSRRKSNPISAVKAKLLAEKAQTRVDHKRVNAFLARVYRAVQARADTARYMAELTEYDLMPGEVEYVRGYLRGMQYTVYVEENPVAYNGDQQHVRKWTLHYSAIH